MNIPQTKISKREVAYHEMAHFVANYVLGIPINRVNIILINIPGYSTDWGGGCFAVNKDHLDTDRWAIATLAGQLGNQLSKRKIYSAEEFTFDDNNSNDAGEYYDNEEVKNYCDHRYRLEVESTYGKTEKDRAEYNHNLRSSSNKLQTFFRQNAKQIVFKYRHEIMTLGNELDNLAPIKTNNHGHFEYVDESGVIYDLYTSELTMALLQEVLNKAGIKFGEAEIFYPAVTMPSPEPFNYQDWKDRVTKVTRTYNFPK